MILPSISVSLKYRKMPLAGKFPVVFHVGAHIALPAEIGSLRIFLGFFLFRFLPAMLLLHCLCSSRGKRFPLLADSIPCF